MGADTLTLVLGANSVAEDIVGRQVGETFCLRKVVTIAIRGLNHRCARLAPLVRHTRAQGQPTFLSPPICLSHLIITARDTAKKRTQLERSMGRGAQRRPLYKDRLFRGCRLSVESGLISLFSPLC